MAIGLNLWRRVDEGLLAAARGGDIELLLVHRRIDHYEGAIHGGSLRRVGSDGVGVFEGRGV
jgi:hypothetical protein